MCKRTCVISSSSCKTASSSSWVKPPLKRSSISYGMNNELHPYCNLQSCCKIKTGWWENKTFFHLISTAPTLWYSIPSLVSSIILSTSSIDIIYNKTNDDQYATGVLLKHLLTECPVVSSFAPDLDCIKNELMLYLTYTPNHWTALFNFSTTGFCHPVRYTLELIVMLCDTS